MSAQTQARATTTAAELALLPDDDYAYELDQGELIRMPSTGEEHGWVDDVLRRLLSSHVTKAGIGKTYANTGFLLERDPDVVRAPDIAFIRKGRLPVPCDPSSGYILGGPDLAVEIQSPSQSPADLQKKVQQYLAAGALAVWVVYPRKRQAAIHRPSQQPVTLTAADFLDAPDLLPALRIPLAEIFKPE